MLLNGKNIIVTGSGRGIGRAVAIACAKEGANIGLTSRTLEQLNNVKKEIEELKQEIVEIEMELKDQVNKITEKWENVEKEIEEYQVTPRRTDVNVEEPKIAWIN